MSPETIGPSPEDLGNPSLEQQVAMETWKVYTPEDLLMLDQQGFKEYFRAHVSHSEEMAELARLRSSPAWKTSGRTGETVEKCLVEDKEREEWIVLTRRS